MIEKESFVIDTNCFIAPYKQYYDFVFESEFWNELEKHIKKGSIILIKAVKDEILDSEDELSDWLKIHNVKVLSERNDSKIVKNYSLIMNYLNDNSIFSQKAQQEWQSPKIADPWIIATAMAKNSTIITFEGNANPIKNQLINKAKIPTIAENFGIKTADLFYMMRVLEFKL